MEKGSFTAVDKQLLLFQNWINEQKLLHVEILLRKKGKQSLSVRMLKYDSHLKTLLLYDVDRKEVLSIDIHQIDRIQPADDAVV
jgi:hypothetical protein